MPAYLSYRVGVVLFVLPSSGRSPPRRLATPSFFFSQQQELPSDTSFLRVLQLAAKVFFIVLLYRMSLSCGISTRRLAAASPSKYWVLFLIWQFCGIPVDYRLLIAAASSSECWVVLPFRSRQELPSASFYLRLCTACETGCNV